MEENKTSDNVVKKTKPQSKDWVENGLNECFLKSINIL